MAQDLTRRGLTSNLKAPMLNYTSMDQVIRD
jgi:hypothetical protein